MQKWEYKLLYRSRGIKSPDKQGWRDADDWNVLDIGVKLQSLGAEGWELVSVSPESDEGNQIINGTGTIAAGMTTSERWVFKRPLA